VTRSAKAGLDVGLAKFAKVFDVPTILTTVIEEPVRRMERAGVVPVTWLVVSSEWQRDWPREETANQLGPILFEHGGATGAALARELQLLAAPTTDGAGA
jgi:hypothetical protein